MKGRRIEPRQQQAVPSCDAACNIMRRVVFLAALVSRTTATSSSGNSGGSNTNHSYGFTSFLPVDPERRQSTTRRSPMYTIRVDKQSQSRRADSIPTAATTTPTRIDDGKIPWGPDTQRVNRNSIWFMRGGASTPQDLGAPRRASSTRRADWGDESLSSSTEDDTTEQSEYDDSSSYENYVTEEELLSGEEGTTTTDDRGREADVIDDDDHVAEIIEDDGRRIRLRRERTSRDSSSSSEEEGGGQLESDDSHGHGVEMDDSEDLLDHNDGDDIEDTPQDYLKMLEGTADRDAVEEGDDTINNGDDDDDSSLRVCVMTWNLAEESPAAKDLEFLRQAADESDLVAVGVQEIENLKPRRKEGGRTREWRRLLNRTLGRDFVRVGHHSMGAVQLTLFARREMIDRVKVIKLTDVVCGVGNVLQNKGGIGAYVRVDRTTFLFVAAHLAAHQGKLEERNAGYWRIVTTLDQEIPPAWVTHAARKRVKRAKAAAEAAAAAEEEFDKNGVASRSPLPVLRKAATSLVPRGGPFEDRVDRVFFFGDLNYRVDLAREDIELGVSASRGEAAGGEGRGSRRGSTNFAPGVVYPGTEALDALLDFDQLTLARSLGKAFGGFSEARVTFEPTYKYDKGASCFDSSRKVRTPAWTDRILFSPAGQVGVSPLEYSSAPNARHSDHRPVYATFKVQLAN